MGISERTHWKFISKWLQRKHDKSFSEGIWSSGSRESGCADLINGQNCMACLRICDALSSPHMLTRGPNEMKRNNERIKKKNICKYSDNTFELKILLQQFTVAINNSLCREKSNPFAFPFAATWLMDMDQNAQWRKRKNNQRTDNVTLMCQKNGGRENHLF